MPPSPSCRRGTWHTSPPARSCSHDADDPTIGTIAVVFVGMSDVSSCVIGEGIEAGTRVGKGDELGYFQFGGSSVCVLFGPDVVESFSLGRSRSAGGGAVGAARAVAPGDGAAAVRG